MKKLKLGILLLSALLMFTSCEETEDLEVNETNVIQESSLIGTWNMTSYESLNGSTTTTFNNETSTIYYSTSGSDFDYQLEISENPNIMSGSGAYTGTITYDNGSSQSTRINTDYYDQNLLSGTWEFNDNILTMTTTDDTTEMEVSLNENILTLTSQLNEVITENYLGYSYTAIARGEVVMTFERVTE